MRPPPPAATRGPHLRLDSTIDLDTGPAEPIRELAPAAPVTDRADTPSAHGGAAVRRQSLVSARSVHGHQRSLVALPRGQSWCLHSHSLFMLRSLRLRGPAPPSHGPYCSAPPVLVCARSRVDGGIVRRVCTRHCRHEWRSHVSGGSGHRCVASGGRRRTARSAAPLTAAPPPLHAAHCRPPRPVPLLTSPQMDTAAIGAASAAAARPPARGGVPAAPAGAVSAAAAVPPQFMAICGATAAEPAVRPPRPRRPLRPFTPGREPLRHEPIHATEPVCRAKWRDARSVSAITPEPAQVHGGIGRPNQMKYARTSASRAALITLMLR